LLLSVSHGPLASNAYVCEDKVDVQISGGCPLYSAINVSRYAALRMGDEASTFGYIYEKNIFISRFWKGVLGGKLGHDALDEKSNTKFLGDEYLFQGVAQIADMSGGPTVNGAGYTGMMHGNKQYENIMANFSYYMASVIPFEKIESLCIKRMQMHRRDLYASLKNRSECSAANILDIPQF
jgi:hypothetical protein